MLFEANFVDFGDKTIYHPTIYIVDGQWFFQGRGMSDRKITYNQALRLAQKGVLPTGDARDIMIAAVERLDGRMPNMKVGEWVEMFSFRDLLYWWWQFGQPAQSTQYRSVRRGSMAVWRALHAMGVWAKVSNSDFTGSFESVFETVNTKVWYS